MQITVTQAHIDAGLRCDCDKCPLVLAFREKVGPCSVGAGTLILFRPSFRMLPLPDEALQFRRDFDEGRPVKPFSFKMTNLLKPDLTTFKSGVSY